MRHLVTGATGFVGGALLLELLTTTEDEVLALVRPGPDGAEARLRRALLQAAGAYGLAAEALPLHRVRAIPGDVTRPGCGAEPAPRFDMLWHSAASLRYEDRFRDEIHATNFQGTAQALALAQAGGAQAVHLISTAYVVGRASGRLSEVAVEDVVSNNHYERSKVAAEGLAHALRDLRVCVFRPSIVVGHSRTLAATTFSGFYGFARQLSQFRAVMEKMQAGLLDRRPLQLRVTPDGPLNLVAVDAVAAQAAFIGRQPGAMGIYHLTEPAPPTIGEAILAVAQAVGLPPPEFVAEDAELDWLDEQLDQRLDFYGSYVRGRKLFDRSRADAALGARGDLRRPAAPPAELAAWYLPRLEAERRARRAAAATQGAGAAS